MQLILETQNTSIDLKEKMTSLDQVAVDEKLITNGDLQNANSDVPNSNKENMHNKSNIILNNEENADLSETKLVALDTSAAVPAEDFLSEKKIVNEDECDEKIVNEDECDEQIVNEDECDEKAIIGKDNEESHNDIIQKTKVNLENESQLSLRSDKENDNVVIEIQVCDENKNNSDPKKEPGDCVDNEENLNHEHNATEEFDLSDNIKLQNYDTEISNSEQKTEPKSDQFLKEGSPELENGGNIVDSDLKEASRSTTNITESLTKTITSPQSFITEANRDALAIECGDISDNKISRNLVTTGCSSDLVENLKTKTNEISESNKIETHINQTSMESDTVTDLAVSEKISPESESIALNENKDITNISMECDKVADLDVSENSNLGQSPMDCDDETQISTNNCEVITDNPVESDDITKKIDNFIQVLNSDDVSENTDDVQNVTNESNDMDISENKSSAQTSMDCDEEKPVTTTSEITREKIVECEDITEKIESFIHTLSSDDATENKDIDKNLTEEKHSITVSENIKNDEETQITTNDNKIVTERSVDSSDEAKQTEDIILAIIPENDLTEKNENISTPSSDDAAKNDDVVQNPINSEAIDAIVLSNENNNTALNTTDSLEEVKNHNEAKTVNKSEKEKTSSDPVKLHETSVKKVTPTICRLSLDILSDDDDEPPKKDTLQDNSLPNSEKQCINIEDDDDIMLIDDKDDKNENVQRETEILKKIDDEQKPENNTVKLDDNKNSDYSRDDDTTIKNESVLPETGLENTLPNPEVHDKISPNQAEDTGKLKPLVSDKFFSTYKKNLADMTRDDLEEFCILKIVESIIDRSNLNEIRTKLKTMAQNIDEYKKKAMMLTKQNRDLQVVLKSVQEEQKKGGESPITPLKITRSVGMQVLMTDKNSRRKGIPPPAVFPTPPNASNTRQIRNAIIQSPRQQTQANNNQQIPVPRLVLATNNTATKTNTPPVNASKTAGKTANSLTNGVKNSTSPQKGAEKRSFNRMQSVTVDLTDDEPPSKIPNKASSAPPVRLVPPQNLMAPRQQVPQQQTVNSPRKVYIPISGPQGQNIRANQTIMLKTVPSPGPRQRGPIAPMVRMPQNPVRMTRVLNGRHPAPLPDAMKQYQPPNWKALPPAPDLKLSKVENGIVISWKIDGYQEDSYEEIASYQLYAYQETSSPPNTALWKKIGDVKALPLPMACTLTQFMAGYKYYFAVRAVDVRSRLGPFSLPGSILLLNKM